MKQILQKSPLSKKSGPFFISIILIISLIIPTVYASEKSGAIQIDNITLEYRNVTVYAPAVGESQNGYIGVISTITVTIQNNGNGRVFVDTLPLAQIDMQGSARLAVKVASSYVQNDKNCSIDPYSYDYFFVIRTEAPIIGGPSAGAIMTTAVIALLENWEMDEKTVMTGMINPDGSIGPIGGIPKKIDAADSVGATRFLIPKGQGTYVEYTTETVNTPWGVQVVSNEETKNVSDYAAERYGIEVIEVEDINEVLLYYTGHYIPVTISNESSTTEKYLSSMEPLATSLLVQSKDSLDQANDLYENTTIPSSFFINYEQQITDALQSAQEAYEDSEEWYNQQKYYTSTSKSFQSLINSRFVHYACDYFNAEDKESYMSDLYEESSSYFENQSHQAKQAVIQGAISLQCIGAAQKRATEASSFFSFAFDLIKQNDDFSAIYQLAFAVQRAESITWWLGLKDQFNETSVYSNNDIDQLATDYIQDAQQAIIYAGVILGEVGSSSSLINEAQSMLDNARDDHNNGFPAAALFEALEALAKANLALELVDATTEEKIESKIIRANQSAHTGITESRNIGIEPILAVSYYEFAESLVDENVQNALFYYKYSDLLTGIHTVSGCVNEDAGSRYVGIPEQDNSIIMKSFSRYQNFFIVSAFIGLLIGALVGIILTMIFLNKEKNNIAQKHSPKYSYSNNISYHESPSSSNHTYSFHSLPTNINDYYRQRPRN